VRVLKCDDGKTALMRAARCAGSETARLLLLKDADPNIQDINGYSALHHACMEGGSSTLVKTVVVRCSPPCSIACSLGAVHDSQVKILLQGKADVNLIDGTGGGCLHAMGQEPSGSVVQTVSTILEW